jgi:hypothetical protein
MAESSWSPLKTDEDLHLNGAEGSGETRNALDFGNGVTTRNSTPREEKADTKASHKVGRLCTYQSTLERRCVVRRIAPEIMVQISERKLAGGWRLAGGGDIYLRYLHT